MSVPGATNARALAGLACDDRGVADERTPLVLLHGLTFDRTMWAPALAELEGLDPQRRALVIDLPGHGASEAWPAYGLESVAEAVHRAVQEAGLDAPVLVGHSLSAIVASVYASRYPTGGVVNVDQPLQIAPFAAVVQSMSEQLRGPQFVEIWPHILASMHLELLPLASQDLVRSTCRPEQHLVLGYWRGPRAACRRDRRARPSSAARGRCRGIALCHRHRHRTRSGLQRVAPGRPPTVDCHRLAGERTLPAPRPSPRLRRGDQGDIDLAGLISGCASSG